MASAEPFAARAAVRRKDRAVDDDAWIVALLQRAPFAVMATVREGQPFVNSNIFVYEEARGEGTGVIYMHTARTGRTPSNVTACERVSLSVSEMGRLLPAERAFNLSVEYSGVVVFGRATVLTDETTQRRALELLAAKYFPHLRQGADYEEPSLDELARTAVYRIEIDEWSGKRKLGEPEHPGAFWYAHTLSQLEERLPT